MRVLRVKINNKSKSLDKLRGKINQKVFLTKNFDLQILDQNQVTIKDLKYWENKDIDFKETKQYSINNICYKNRLVC